MNKAGVSRHPSDHAYIYALLMTALEIASPPGRF